MGKTKGSNDKLVLSWKAFEAELDAFQAQGKFATFWWRDDDAALPNQALNRILSISANKRTPLSLAVIPTKVHSSLSEQITQGHDIFIAAHGYSHANHAGPLARKVELGGCRPISRIIEELKKSFSICADLFSDRYIPVLVPPWNRIADDLKPRLSEIGFLGLSVLGPRSSANEFLDLAQVNVHVDIIDWKRRSFLGEVQSLQRFTAHLKARREGTVDTSEPTGLLTHHLMHDEEAWEFLNRFIEFTHRHPATHWLSMAQAFNLIL